MSDLERRLGELPGHLEAYFKHMLDTIEDVYRRQTARTFQIMVNASATLPLIAFHFLDHENQDPDYALHEQMRFFDEGQINRIIDKKRRQINARCKDLLEITEDQDEHLFFMHRVGFLHRTVLDFIRTNDMVTLMSTRSGPGFNPNLSLCRSYLAQMKAMPDECRSEPLTLRNLVLGTIYYARELEILDGLTQAELLDELEYTMLCINLDPADPWNKMIPDGHCGSFLEISVRYGLQLYVGLKVNGCSAKLQETDGIPLLCHALRTSISLDKGHMFEASWMKEINISMLRLLLGLGASPNHIIDFDRGHTVWSDFLMRCRKTYSRSQTNVWDLTKFLKTESGDDCILSNTFEACELMMIHGAGSEGPFLDTTHLLHESFANVEANQLEKLLQTKQKLPQNEKISVTVEERSILWKVWKTFRGRY
jgi:hypothetical protein